MNLGEADFEYDPDDPEGFRAGVYPPGGRHLFRRADAVDYYEGE